MKLRTDEHGRVWYEWGPYRLDIVELDGSEVPVQAPVFAVDLPPFTTCLAASAAGGFRSLSFTQASLLRHLEEPGHHPRPVCTDAELATLVDAGLVERVQTCAHGIRHAITAEGRRVLREAPTK